MWHFCGSNCGLQGGFAGFGERRERTDARCPQRIRHFWTNAFDAFEFVTSSVAECIFGHDVDQVRTVFSRCEMIAHQVTRTDQTLA